MNWTQLYAEIELLIGIRLMQVKKLSYCHYILI